MYVGQKMRKDLVTVTTKTPVLKARELMKDHHIKHLPVVDSEMNLMGILTDRDLKAAWASPATSLSVYELTYILEKLTVDSIMTKEVITVTPDTSIERAAKVIQDNRIHSLPVLKDKKLVGIITSTDLMDILLDALGINEGSKRVYILVKNRIGTLARIANLLSEEKIDIRSIVTLPLTDRPDVGHMILRVRTDDFDLAVTVLEKAGFKVLSKYEKDLSPFIPD